MASFPKRSEQTAVREVPVVNERCLGQLQNSEEAEKLSGGIRCSAAFVLVFWHESDLRGVTIGLTFVYASGGRLLESWTKHACSGHF